MARSNRESRASSIAEPEPVYLQQSLSPAGVPQSTIRDGTGHTAFPGTVPQITQSPLDESSPSYRPSMNKKAGTEAPAPMQRVMSILPPAMKRAGTDVSKLQERLWHGEHDSDSSSDESTDEDDVERRDTHPSDQTPRARSKRLGDSADPYRKFRVGDENYQTKGKVSRRDGRLAISINETSSKGYLVKALGAAAKKVVPSPQQDGDDDDDTGGVIRPAGRRLSSATTATPADFNCPRLNIVVMVIGSRGDIQPFIKIGQVLKEQYGHRVRIATHPVFREFVEKDSGLEFFSVGGDPSELMAFMVKNPGLIPSLDSVKAGDIGRRRSAMAEMFDGFWRACINDTDDESNPRNRKMMSETDPFVADAIIANPPSFAHVHCAEALGIPLHMMFTMPYTPTQAFPHPLASIRRSNVDPGYTNFMSYPLVEMMIWQGLGDLVNHFRQKTLGLDPVSTLWAPGAIYRLHVPFTYLFSPSLVPKPKDWGSEIDVAGFVFLDLGSSFTPPDPLVQFLEAGEAPVYIGFGSIVVDDPDKFTEMIFQAVKQAGVRALVSKGWGGLGGEEDVPDNIFMLDNTPHDWLFPRVKAAVIHGGAGTTAIALKCGLPTMICSFFGDQSFWNSMVSAAKAGPDPISYKRLTVDKLAEGIKYCLTDEARVAAREMSKDIEHEGDGAENACVAFHRHLTLSGKHSMRCSISNDRVATWLLKKTSLRLSPMAASILVDKGQLSWKKLVLVRHNEWNDFEGPGEPVTGLAGSIVGTASNVFSGVAGVPARLAKTTHRRQQREERRKKKREAKMQKLIESKDDVTPQARLAVQRTMTGATDATNATDANDTYAHDIGEGLGKSAKALAVAPVNLSMALAQGFHNAPRLYGDNSVRRPRRVTGIKSGVNAAGYEFVFGIYDAWTGLVRLPVHGARNGGAVGFAKGVGMGTTGFVLKNISALISPVGYTLKGVKKQAERSRQPYTYVRRARIRQGQIELGEIPDAEREQLLKQVLEGWQVMRALWEAVERQEKDNGGLRGKMGARRHRAIGDAFENVAMAQHALAAVQGGETVQTAVRDAKKESLDREYEKGTKHVLGENSGAGAQGTQREGLSNFLSQTNGTATGTAAGGGEATSSSPKETTMGTSDQSWDNLVNGTA